MITGGQAVVRSLLAHGVTDVFGVPGIQLDPLYNAIFDEGRPFDVVTARHEQGSAYMALGYAATSDRVGVLVVVPGPGLLNASAGLATAWAMSAPVVTLCGQIPSTAIDRGTGLLHEIPGQPTLVAPFTRSQRRATRAEEISELVARSFADATAADPRPVHLELPPDVLAAECDDTIAPPTPTPPTETAATTIAEAARLLAEAHTPMLVVGGGAQPASALVTALAERLGAPVVSNRRGRGVVDSRHPLSVAVLAGQELWPEVDVVVAIGSRLLTPLSDWGTDDGPIQIWIDPDESAPTRVGEPRVHIRARAEDVLGELLDALAGRELAATDQTARIEAAEAAEHAVVDGLRPQVDHLDAIRAALPSEGILVSDLTQVGYVSKIAYPVHQPRTYLYPAYMGTLGWALPTALGAKVANPDVPVVAVMGDGGFGFTAMELATAVQYGIATTTIVFDNRGYGNVRIIQRDTYGGRVHATDLHSPDLIRLAESFGARAVRAESPSEVHAALTTSIGLDEPTVIWVPHGDWPNPWPRLSPQRVRG